MITKEFINQVKDICQSYGIKPTKDKGQNFLLNQEVIDLMIESSQVTNQDVVLEVGPGLGILTESLVKQARQVVSVELDKRLFTFLKTKFINQPNLKLVEADILKFDVADAISGEYKIVANLPYTITSFFLKKFLTGPATPKSFTLLLQKEVAERICALPGAMSLLAVSVQLYGQPKIIEVVSRHDFWPSPKVDSAIIQISAIKDKVAVDNFFSGLVTEKFFWQVVKIGFAARRKQLHNNLASGLKIPPGEVKKILNQANFDEQIRAQNLSVNDWLRLSAALSSYLKK
ncbi:MAG: ribosomal RNA small subunit methyltransferase A [Candidatus Buchananbacteria bacterium]|nr:ribosomal RNA small subunit methyltransferase A [Candidatus Buchananbacteria bacterium]